jgi:galactokinase
VRVLKNRGASIPALQLRIASDVPVGAGLSSAALEVATIRAIGALLGLDLAPDEIAALAHKAEVEHAGVACGVMDQIACSFGEPGLMLFLDTMTMERRLVPCRKTPSCWLSTAGFRGRSRERSTIDAAPNARPPQRCSGYRACAGSAIRLLWRGTTVNLLC